MFLVYLCYKSRLWSCGILPKNCRVAPSPLGTQTGPCDARHSSFHPGKNSVLPTFHLLRISYIRNSIRPTFHLLQIFHIRRLTPDGRGERFNFPGQTYPDPLIALIRRVSQIFCTVSRCSPEASRYVRPTF